MKPSIAQPMGRGTFKPTAVRRIVGLVALVSLLPAWAQVERIATAVVQSKSVGVSYELDGVIQPVKQSTISAQASGRIAGLMVKAGDQVKTGQLLATIDDRETAAGVQRSQAQINQTDAELRNARAGLERTRDLQAKGFVSKAALDAADAQYQSAAAMREQATAVARQSGIAQGFTRVVAPYDGWVSQTYVEAGDLAVPGKPLLTVYAPTPLRAVVQVPASRAQAVRSAAQTTIQVEDPSGAAQLITPITRSAVPSADPVSQTTEWRLELPPKATTALVPGQQVRVSFVQSQGEGSARLTVPTAAILRRGELTAVYVVQAQGFALRAIRVAGASGDSGTEVLAGLTAGERVALDPVRAGFAHAQPAAQSK